MAVSIRKRKFKIDEIYSDFDINMVSESKDLKKIRDLDSIMNSIKNIVYTYQGERPMGNLKFGSVARMKLFEPMTDDNLMDIGESIVSDIKNHEPRVYVSDCEIEGDEDHNAVKCNLTIQVLTFETQEKYELEFFLRR